MVIQQLSVVAGLKPAKTAIATWVDGQITQHKMSGSSKRSRIQVLPPG